LGSVKAEKAAFLALHGKQYGYNGWLDRNWQREVGDRLGSTLRHYLDFTGVLPRNSDVLVIMFFYLLKVANGCTVKILCPVQGYAASTLLLHQQ
jgi:hypothetical protein